METYAVDFKGTGVKAIVSNQKEGGSTGTSFTLSNGTNAVETLTVWVARGQTHTDRDLVKGIKVKWRDGTERLKGKETGTEYSFKFDDGEKVTDLSLWTGDRVDKISLTTEGRPTWTHGGHHGTKRTEELGNGILIGFTGSADSYELVSLGAKFKEASD